MNDDYTPQFEDYPPITSRRSGRATEAQLASLKEMSIDVHGGLSFDDADQLIRANIDKWHNLPATPKQVAFLECELNWPFYLPIPNRGEAARFIGIHKTAANQ